MIPILIEDLLFLALLGAGIFIVYTLVIRLTPAGRRLAQVRNRRRIDQGAGMRCPVHGHHGEEELVRLPGGDVMCPECYAEAMNDDRP